MVGSYLLAIAVVRDVTFQVDYFPALHCVSEVSGLLSRDLFLVAFIMLR